MQDEAERIAENIARVRQRIAEAARRSGRDPGAVTLIGVTKTVPAERVAAAFRAGVTVFGENYVQEARDKIPAVNAATGKPPVWHLIGHLQTNKAKYAVDLFDVVQTVDSARLAQEIGRQASKRSGTQRVLIEVNLSGEAQRAGVLPEGVAELAEVVARTPGVVLEGLMGMAPVAADPAGARPHFDRLRRLWEALPAGGRGILSMGMSGDFEVAIEEGATHVRIGTALFGNRAAAAG